MTTTATDCRADLQELKEKRTKYITDLVSNPLYAASMAKIIIPECENMTLEEIVDECLELDDQNHLVWMNMAETRETVPGFSFYYRFTYNFLNYDITYSTVSTFVKLHGKKEAALLLLYLENNENYVSQKQIDKSKTERMDPFFILQSAVCISGSHNEHFLPMFTSRFHYSFPRNESQNGIERQFDDLNPFGDPSLGVDIPEEYQNLNVTEFAEIDPKHPVELKEAKDADIYHKFVYAMAMILSDEFSVEKKTEYLNQVYGLSEKSEKMLKELIVAACGYQNTTNRLEYHEYKIQDQISQIVNCTIV